jgi:hypothetical protein
MVFEIQNKIIARKFPLPKRRGTASAGGWYLFIATNHPLNQEQKPF